MVLIEFESSLYYSSACVHLRRRSATLSEKKQQFDIDFTIYFIIPLGNGGNNHISAEYLNCQSGMQKFFYWKQIKINLKLEVEGSDSENVIKLSRGVHQRES